jgi:regulator of replication initiation timing
MDIDVVKNQFDDIEEKIEFLIEYCKSLESENSDLRVKMSDLEQTLQSKTDAEEQLVQEKNIVRSRIDVLLEKLNYISESGEANKQPTL